MHQVRGNAGIASRPPSFVVCLAACAVALLLAACGGSGAELASSSPSASLDTAKVTVSASSQMSEESQLIDIVIPFDKDLSVEGDASEDVRLSLDGEGIDSSAIATEVVAQGKSLHVRLSPAQGTGAPGSGKYFALYQAKLSVSSAQASGALPHVVGQDGAAAKMEGECELYLPSGMKAKVISQDATSTTVKVTQTAQVRCCTWFAVGDQRFYMHHHLFIQETPASCAKQMAGDLENSLSDDFQAKAKGSTVVITRTKGSGKFDVSILEGRDS